VAARQARDACRRRAVVGHRAETAPAKPALNDEEQKTFEKELTMSGPTNWKGFRSILCPIDFSDHSRLALRYAVAVALRGKAALRVIYVNDPLLAAAAAALHDRHAAKRAARELQEFIDAAAPAKARMQLQVTSQVSMGNPSDQILKTASKRGTDLIVLGTHGLTGVDRLFMGSTTLGVLQHTAVPVLAIPRGRETPTSPVSASWPGARIVAAIDLHGGVGSEVETAARITQWFGASLLLAHVLNAIAVPAWRSADLTAHERIRLAQAQRQMDALAAVAQRRVTTDVRVACGNVADEIAALAADQRAELLLTTLRDRRRWFGAKRGSISYHVLSHAVAPVLAYPSQWRAR
jgi:nucleotide-binding universal stress UspA family protein